MNLCRRILLWLPLLPLLAPSPARGGPPLAGGRMARPLIVIGGLTVEERYRDLSGQKGFFQVTVAPLVEVKSKSGGNDHALSYSPSLVMNHRDGSREVDHDLNFTSKGRVAPKIAYSVSERFLRTDRPLDNQNAAGLLAERLRGRERYWTQNLGLETRLDYAPKSAVTLGYNHEILRNDAQGLADHDRHTPSVALSWQFDPKWRAETSLRHSIASFTGGGDDFSENDATARLEYQASHFDRINATYNQKWTNYDGGTPDLTLATLSAGWNRALSPTANMDLNLGMSRSDRDDGSRDKSLAYSLSLSQKLNNANLLLAGEGGFDNLRFNGLSQGLSRYWGFRATVDKPVAKGLDASLFAAYRKDLLLEQIPEDEQDSYSAGGALNYSFYKGYSAATSYSYRKLVADSSDSGFDEHRYSLSLTIPFPDNDYSFGAGYSYRQQEGKNAAANLEDHEIFFRLSARKEIW